MPLAKVRQQNITTIRQIIQYCALNYPLVEQNKNKSNLFCISYTYDISKTHVYHNARYVVSL